MEEPTKPNCYKCKHRGEIPGDCHSRCKHPKTGAKDMNLLEALVTVASGKSLNFSKAAHELGVTGDQIGVLRGWFYWPMNFDPTWLLTCNGFETKE